MINLTGWQFLLVVIGIFGLIDAITLKWKGFIFWPISQVIGLIFALIVAILETIKGNY